VANLFSKLSTKFHQNRRIFVEDIAKKHFGHIFLDTLHMRSDDLISNSIIDFCSKVLSIFMLIWMSVV